MGAFKATESSFGQVVRPCDWINLLSEPSFAASALSLFSCISIYTYLSTDNIRPLSLFLSRSISVDLFWTQSQAYSLFFILSSIYFFPTFSLFFFFEFVLMEKASSVHSASFNIATITKWSGSVLPTVNRPLKLTLGVLRSHFQPWLIS